MFEKYLQDIGLTDKEAAIYLALLSYENASVLELAEKTKIKRPTVYVIIESLAKKGLVSETTLGKKTHYYAEPPERLETFVERKILNLEDSKKILKDVVPQLKSVSREHGEKPIVKYFDGKEGVFSSSDEIAQILGGDELMYGIYPKDAVDETFNEEELKKLRSKRVSKGVKNKVIYTSSKETSSNAQLSERIKIDGGEYPVTCDITIYKDVTLITILEKRISAILIKNVNVAETMRTLFKLVFDNKKT